MVMVNLQHQHLICTSMDANGMNTTLQSEEVISGWVKESKKTSGTRSGRKPSGYKQPHPPESGDIQFIKEGSEPCGSLPSLLFMHTAKQYSTIRLLRLVQGCKSITSPS